LNAPPELPQHWGQNNLNLNNYHSDPMEIGSTFWLPDITDWWWQQEETHPKFDDFSNGARDRFSIISHGIRVEASLSYGRNLIRWRQSKTTGESLCVRVVVMQCGRANSGLLAGDDPLLDPNSTDNNMELKTVAEEKDVAQNG
jgi:hypothetical protein